MSARRACHESIGHAREPAVKNHISHEIPPMITARISVSAAGDSIQTGNMADELGEVGEVEFSDVGIRGRKSQVSRVG